GRVIAIDPVLVCVAGLGNVNRVVPMHTIFGAADGDVHTACNGQGVNQPHTMLQVVSDGCVTGGRVAATLIPLGKARQISVGPGNSAVSRCGPADVSTATAGYAGDLKRGHDRWAIRESSRLYFRHVLAASIGEAVLAELPKNALCAGRNGAQHTQGANQRENECYPAEAAAVARRNLCHRESAFFLGVGRPGRFAQKSSRLRRTAGDACATG